MSIRTVVADQKLGHGIAAATTGSGISLSWLDVIPNDIGKLATVVGILLSCVLIYTHMRKGRLEYEKVRLELKLMREKEERRALEEAARYKD